MPSKEGILWRGIQRASVILVLSNEAVIGSAIGAAGGGAYAGPAISQSDTAFVRFENVLWHDNKAGVWWRFAGITNARPGEVIDFVNNTFSRNTPMHIIMTILYPL